MGLENLKSVFNDLSENQISNSSKLTPHASRLDDIEYNLISDPNSGAGMLHGILTGGDQYVFELPNPPDKKPLTGRDTSDYNDILNHSTIDPKSGLHSPVSDMSKNSSNFQYYSPFPTLDSDFQNASIRLLSGQSLIEDDKHTFGTKGAHDKLIKINRIEKLQEDSPQTKQERIEIIAKEIKINKVASTGEGDLFQNLGVNSRLGEGDFNWTSLYNSNHTPIEERTPINLGRVDKDGNAILLNTLRSGMGSLGNLDIMGNSSGKLMNFRGFDRGNEPYIVKPIGSNDYTTLVNRDWIPFNRATDDLGRLAKFYMSPAGIAFMAKENVTNFLIGKFDYMNPFGAIMAPPLPNPIQGNTGFLNITNVARDLGNKRGSIRRPIVIEYSSRANVGLPFAVLGDTTVGMRELPQIEIPPDESSIVKKRLYELKRAVLNKLETAAQFPHIGSPTPFIDLKGGPKNTTYYDHIAKTGVESEEEDFFTGEKQPPLENEGTYINQGDFYVRIKDLRANDFIYFRGYVTGITENVNPAFTPTNYIGRSEPVYLYERAERDLSFNLRVYPHNQIEFELMYEKMEKLTSLAYPEYFPNDPGASLVRMKAPFTELYMAHIGSRAQGQFGFIKSISYTVNESGDWDALSALPKLFDIAISYQILNRKPPSMGDKFYRVGA